MRYRQPIVQLADPGVLRHARGTQTALTRTQGDHYAMNRLRHVAEAITYEIHFTDRSHVIRLQFVHKF